MQTEIAIEPAADPTAAGRRGIAVLAVLLAQFMLVLDATVVNVALPSIQADLHLRGAWLTWVNNAYLIAFGGLLLLFGRLGDLVGRRRIFLIGLGLFTAASAACGLAGTAAMLVGARFVQGVGAAAASSVVLAIIATEFPEPAERAKAMSGYMFVSVAGGSLGLLVGGALTQALGWHWVFLINVPFGLAAIPLAMAVLRETPAPGLAGGIDVAGAVLVTGSAMTAIYALVAASTHPWTAAAVMIPGIAAVLLLVSFLAWEARVANPLMPLRILRVRSLVGSSVVRGFLIMGMYAVYFFGVLDMSHTLGFGPMRVGLAFLPQTTVVALLALGVTARLIARFGARAVLLSGLSLVALALWTLARQDADAPYWPWRFLSYALLGLGAGNSFLPLLTLAMSEVPSRDAGLGSAIVNVSLQLAAAFGLAVLGSVASYRTDMLVQGHLAARDALVGGYRFAYGVAVGGVLVGLALAAVVLRPQGGARGAALDRLEPE
jgi:EmrB/QacA subfamily drug resistance transporter